MRNLLNSINMLGFIFAQPNNYLVVTVTPGRGKKERIKNKGDKKKGGSKANFCYVKEK